MKCGVCLKPSTPIEALDDLLAGDARANISNNDNADPLIEMVDLLAVNPGFAGQIMQTLVVRKSKELRKKWPHLKHIAIDGGVNLDTSKQLKHSGANMFVAGTAIFGADRFAEDGPELPKQNYNRLMKSLTS